MRTTEVGWVTSEESPNRTASRAAVYATDLGILWDDGDGGVLAAFGDSYGAGWSAPVQGRGTPTGGATCWRRRRGRSRVTA
ncbi:MAG: DUF4185 domain-containing protein [Nocardioidaceae bacterium]